MGLAAWLLDHNDADGQPAAAVVAALNRSSSATGELTRDEILDNITLYWLTNTGVSASRLYWEYKGGFFNAKGVNIPVAVSVFPGEQYEAPRSWTERAYPKLIHYNKLDKGGHFAAWEEPQLFAASCVPAFDRFAGRRERHDDDPSVSAKHHSTRIKGDSHDSCNRKATRRRRPGDPAVHDRDPRGGARGAAQAHKGDEMA